MSLSAVKCPDCGEWFTARTGITATRVWSEHFAAAHAVTNEGEKR